MGRSLTGAAVRADDDHPADRTLAVLAALGQLGAHFFLQPAPFGRQLLALGVGLGRRVVVAFVL